MGWSARSLEKSRRCDISSTETWVKEMEDREFRSKGSTAKKVADEFAGWMVLSVLDFVAKKEQGRGWAQVLEAARTTEAHVLVRKTITGSPKEVLEGVRLFFDACAAIYKSEEAEGRTAEVQVRLLLDRLDTAVSRVMPAVQELIEMSPSAIAKQCEIAAEKASRREPKKHATPAAPRWRIKHRRRGRPDRSVAAAAIARSSGTRESTASSRPDESRSAR